MSELLCKKAYENAIAATRDSRMKWWREARYGMFIHYGLYSQLARNEWVMALENYPMEEYEKLADQFLPEIGAPRKWVELAKKAGMKYVVLTTRHHEGFSLWDSKVNPYNSVNYGCHRDIVQEFVDACRELGLKIGFYSSLMDWHHPDSWKCAFDMKARTRYNDYIRELNRELMTNYGKIDILWYDVARPMTSWEGWDSLTLNQMVRELQPEIIINNRSLLEEDFSTPEERIVADKKDWEACMTFNGISWGYVDSAQAAAYSYNAQGILKMLNTVTFGSGNLLLNIGPMPNGAIPEEVIEPLLTVGNWLEKNGDAVYGKKINFEFLSATSFSGVSYDGEKVYCWNRIWPEQGELVLGGFLTKLKTARFLATGEPIAFEQDHYRITLKDLPKKAVDHLANVTIIELVFEEEVKQIRASRYPQLNGGYAY